MTWYLVPGQGNVWLDEGQAPGEGATQLPTYWNTWQYQPSEGSTVGGPHFQWSIDVPGAGMAPQGYDIAPGYLGTLLDYAAKAEMGTLTPLEREQWDDMRTQAQAIPTRDLARLYLSWGGKGEDEQGQWALSPGSPDAGAVMLELRRRIQAGQATAEEDRLYRQLEAQAREWDWRASVPQPSDAFNPLGDQFFMALNALTMAGGGMAATAPGASLLTQVAYGAGAAAQGAAMTGEALDSQALRQAAMALGLVGAGAGATQAVSSGIHSFSDALRLAQRVYGVGNKAYQAAQAWSGQSGPEDPAQAGLANPQERLYSMDPAYARTQRTTGTLSQAQQGSTSSRTGGTPMAEASTFEQLAQVVAGLVGAAGTGLSLADVQRYLGQLKDLYGEQRVMREMLTQAYTLAASRADLQQAQTQEDYAARLARYQQEQQRFTTFYGEQRQEQTQRQEAYALSQQQLAEDRARLSTTWGEDRERALAAYDKRVQQAEEDRQLQRGIFSQDRATFLDAYNQQRAEAAQARGMDLAGYQARQQIGAGLRDPAQIAAGAQGVYQPLSALAREQISREVQGEMGMRGVSPEGQYANLMSAKAFAPLEQQMYQNALQAWLNSQQTALGAYAPVSLTGTPTYTPPGIPRFTTAPEYSYAQVPTMPRTSAGAVPGTVGYQASPDLPSVPGAVQPPTNLLNPNFTAKPPEPFGTTQATGSTAMRGLGELITTLTKAGGVLAPGGALAGLLAKLLGTSPTTNPTFYSEPVGPGLGWDPYNPQQYDEPIGPGLGWDAPDYDTSLTYNPTFYDQPVGPGLDDWSW